MKKLTLSVAVLLFATISLFAQAKGDPWIKKYYNDTYRREPTVLEYNIQNYNSGSWNNYDELVKYIGEYQKSIKTARITFKFSSNVYKNNVVVGVFQNGTQLAASLISLDGGKVIAAGGGNIISGGAGNVIAAGGGNVIAAGGGNIAVYPDTKGASFGGSYILASAGTKVIKTSGKGAMIIR